jgi:NADH:ubiquinone oxidoreductase subunit 3 (subunit A)
MSVIQLFIPISLFTMIFGIVYFAIITNHREKIAMIESGMNPNEENKKEKRHNKLRAALLFVFVPVGILVGRLLFKQLQMEAEVCQLIFAFLFGGLGLSLTYILEQTVLKNKDTKDAE